MTKKESIRSYEVKNSRTGFPVPVLNDIHLHSAYDPKKEATSFVTNHIEQIKNREYILVLGLGFAYHLQAIAEVLSDQIENKKFLVIEPNAFLFDDCKRLNLLPNNVNIEVICEKSVEDLYAHQSLRHFLIKKPALLSHAASFNLNKLFFTNFLSYRASDEITDMFHILPDEVYKHLTKFSSIRTINDYTQFIKTNDCDLTDIDQFLLAYYCITQTNSERHA